MTRWIKALVIPVGFTVFTLVSFSQHWWWTGALNASCAVADLLWPMVSWPRRPHVHLV